ncbi:MAG: hypothetical protein DMG80_05910 [Acidobacteria bacterium]|jgi:hypothetical protein|nr:MAG: hypothetical protein DMG80_05910 [Acidobacteriota bacterium]
MIGSLLRSESVAAQESSDCNAAFLPNRAELMGAVGSLVGPRDDVRTFLLMPGGSDAIFSSLQPDLVMAMLRQQP